MTGVTNLDAKLGPKQLEILHELMPMATSIALLINPANPATEIVSKDMQTAARILGLQLHLVHASTDSDLGTRARHCAWSILRQPNRTARRTGDTSCRAHNLSADFASAGGLMGLAAPVAEQWRLVGAYTGRILKGDKPGALPVQQSTKIDLTINMNAAKALGLTAPAALLSRADKVIILAIPHSPDRGPPFVPHALRTAAAEPASTTR
jgi:putative ABC transport system substrate-binding protein